MITCHFSRINSLSNLELTVLVIVQLYHVLKPVACLNIYCRDPVDMAFWGYGCWGQY